MTKRCSESVLLVLFLFSFLESTVAQLITGNIVGTVRDETGSVVPGALATIRSPALLGGPATFVTNEKGQYRFPALAPGVYGLTVEITGFRTHVEEGLRVQVGATLEINISLPLAAVAESVTVYVTSNLYSPNFAKPDLFVPPRRAMIGVKFSF
jgi:hypothetical protein